MNGTVIVMLVKHITQSLNESARVKEKRMPFFRLSIELIESVCEQIGGAGEITYKKMFGEYGIYCNGKIKPLLLKVKKVCDLISLAGRKKFEVERGT